MTTSFSLAAGVENLCVLIVSAFAHFLWQGALVGTLVAAIIGVLRRDVQPRTRHVIYLSGLAALTACPIITLGSRTMKAKCRTM